MADHAIHTQLPIMVRKPKVVWPGLAKMGMYQKEIAGDGNCLFASLSDQLFGTPVKHPEIRSNIIVHMRTYRPLFEHYVHKDDVQQRRLLRSSTLAARSMPIDDAFEEYLLLMARNGTYGGEPELVAFCQVYDQDVTVHLPTIQGYDRDSILYRNEQRFDTPQPQPLHICYGGDEVTRAHYDSARSKDGPNVNIFENRRTGRRRSLANSDSGSQSSEYLHVRAMTNGSPDVSSEKIQEFLRKTRRDLEGRFEQLNDRYRQRSPSISSSRRSSSSKRSLEDDTEHRTIKKADRRKSMKKRADALVPAPDATNDMSFKLQIDSPSPSTPASTQDTEYSSDAAEVPARAHMNDTAETPAGVEEVSDSEAVLERAMRVMKSHSKTRKAPPSLTEQINHLGQIEVANAIEPRRTSLRQ